MTMQLVKPNLASWIKSKQSEAARNGYKVIFNQGRYATYAHYFNGTYLVCTRVYNTASQDETTIEPRNVNNPT